MDDTTATFTLNMYAVTRIYNGEIIAPDADSLEVKYHQGKDQYGNDYWVVTSKEFTLPEGYTLYVYYGSENSAESIPSYKNGWTVAWQVDGKGDVILSKDQLLAAAPTNEGDYIYYKFVKGTSFDGVSVQHGPTIPEGTPVSNWIPDGQVHQ